MGVRTKRVYEPPSEADGRRYLIDRLWPRGVRKDDARLAGWIRDLAPSRELRLWYGHEPARYEEFRRRFREELDPHSDLLDRLATEARGGTVTLVFAARDAERCNAAVVRELVEERMKIRRRGAP